MASEKITALVEQVKELTVVELAELVHTLEEVFGVSAAAAAEEVLLIMFFRMFNAITHVIICFFLFYGN